jgi:hypothetical protein
MRALQSLSQTVAMRKFIVRHSLGILLPSIVIILFVSAGLALAQQRLYEPYPANDDEGSYEFVPATIVVRWSQLAEDNAFAVDPAISDPFPIARGWTMMYLAMHDALNAIAPKYWQYAFFGALMGNDIAKKIVETQLRRRDRRTAPHAIPSIRVPSRGAR